MTVAIDPTTGGIRGVQSIGEETARLGQQLTIVGLVGPDGKPAPSRMRGADLRGRLRRPRAGPGDHDGHPPRPARRPPARLVPPAVPALGRPADPGNRHPALPTSTPPGSRRSPRPTPGRITWPADGPGPTRNRPSGGPPCSPRAPPRPSGPRRPRRSTSPRDSDGRPSSSAAWPTTAARGRGCSTRSSSPARRRRGRFTLGVALDLEHPFPATLDLTAPALRRPDRRRPPAIRPDRLAPPGRPQGRRDPPPRIHRQRRRTRSLRPDRRPDRDRRQSRPLQAPRLPRPLPSPAGRRPRRAHRRPPARRRRRPGRLHAARDRPGRIDARQRTGVASGLTIVGW